MSQRVFDEVQKIKTCRNNKIKMSDLDIILIIFYMMHVVLEELTNLRNIPTQFKKILI